MTTLLLLHSRLLGRPIIAASVVVVFGFVFRFGFSVIIVLAFLIEPFTFALQFWTARPHSRRWSWSVISIVVVLVVRLFLPLLVVVFVRLMFSIVTLL